MAPLDEVGLVDVLGSQAMKTLGNSFWIQNVCLSASQVLVGQSTFCSMFIFLLREKDVNKWKTEAARKHSQLIL